MAATKTTNSIPADKLEQYEKLVLTNKNIERKGATVPYTSVNGHMFSYLDKEGALCLRLSKEDRDNFILKYKTKLCEAYGIVMKEYALVPASLLKNTKELKPWFDLSYKYIASLKSKPTKKKTVVKKKAAVKSSR